MKSHGILPTSQRVKIASVLLGRKAHFSAEQIYNLVGAGAELSKATVYNTLGLFVDKGLLRQVIVSPGKVFYDPTTEPHHHFYNVESGELHDIDADEIDIGGLPQVPVGMEIEGVDIMVRIRRSS